MKPLVAPLLLSPDNFTAPTRTPWGGLHIANHYKCNVIDARWRDQAIGESWELSAGDELPSRDLNGVELRTRFSDNAQAWLGAEATSGNTTALLVKLLDTADDLSVQIHPSDDDPNMGAGNTGKTEAWFVVRADPGAVIYLGLNDSVTERQMRTALESGADVSRLLKQWPVVAGDFFVVEPGTPHAIGRGISLVEPQTATSGKRALTYRYWDWNRRYDAHGKLDPSGTSRDLHVERALAVTRWPTHGVAIKPPTFRTAPFDLNAMAHWQALCGPDAAPCPSTALRAGQLIGDGVVQLPAWNVLRALTVLSGEVVIESPQTAASASADSRSLHVVAGQTAALPACANQLTAHLTRAHAMVSAVNARAL